MNAGQVGNAMLATANKVSPNLLNSSREICEDLPLKVNSMGRKIIECHRVRR